MVEAKFEQCEMLGLKMFVTALIVTIIGFIILTSVISYQKYYYNKGIVYRDGSEFYLKMYVDIEDIEDVIKNSVINIDGEEHNYYVYYIQKDLYVNESYNNYQEIMIKTDLKYPVDNRVVNISIKTKKEKVIKFIFNCIKGGIS